MSESKSLPPSLEVAVENLAALVHAAWVETRTSSGWQYGPVRDDAARLSPALVPYDQLSESERELDRVTVRRTLHGLRQLGFELELESPQAATASRAHLLAQANALVSRGQPLPAYDLTKRWLERFPHDDEIRLCNARALRRCGALHRALQVLAVDADKPDADGERRGLIAAVHKEMFVRANRRPSAEAVEHLRHAQALYHQVFAESGGRQYWHGINAATLAFLSGDEDSARELADRVYAECAADDSASYWPVATRGEAALLLGRFDQAATEYRAAVKIAADRVGDLAATRRNALLLLDACRADAADRRAIEAALRPPAVVVFAGLPVDTVGALSTGFPPALESEVRTALAERLDALGAGFAYSGAAPGSELLFVETMLERQPRVVNVVLPWPREQFAETHVRAAGDGWRKRFTALVGDDTRPPLVQHLVNATLGIGVDSPLYERFAQQLAFGLSRLQAARLATDVVPLVVWDGSRRAGNVGEVVEHWETQGLRLTPEHMIDVAAFGKRRPPQRDAAASRFATAPPTAAPMAFRVMAILFADVEDYSKIPERQLPSFIEYFVGGIAARLNLKPYKADNIRRVGDGLLMVFSSVRDAAICALDLVEWIRGHSQAAADGETFWSRAGLPRELRMRVALHAGPVFECVDPLTHAATFEGAHINYAARIEPVTPGNQVYASEAFAALAASWPAPSDEFVCEYVGETTLAKKFGDYPLYHVRRRQ